MVDARTHIKEHPMTPSWPVTIAVALGTFLITFLLISAFLAAL